MNFASNANAYMVTISIRNRDRRIPIELAKDRPALVAPGVYEYQAAFAGYSARDVIDGLGVLMASHDHDPADWHIVRIWPAAETEWARSYTPTA